MFERLRHRTVLYEPPHNARHELVPAQSSSSDSIEAPVLEIFY
jgi:hypothetical protein